MRGCPIVWQWLLANYVLTPLTFSIIFIFPIAIVYSIGQIIKSVCICQSVSVGTLTVTFPDRFSPKLAQT